MMMANVTPHLDAEAIPDAADQHDDVMEDDLSVDHHQLTSVNRAELCNSRRLISCCSSGTQVSVRPDTRDMATQYEEKDTICHSTPVSSSPLASSVPSNDQDDDCHLGTHTSTETESSNSDASLKEEPGCQPSRADKYIVCHDELMELFSVCNCGKRAEAFISKKSGTFIEVKQTCCYCGHTRSWRNQPVLHGNMPICNLLLSGAMHFTGCMVAQTLRMLSLLGVQTISAGTYFRHQTLYTTPAIVLAWQEEQNTLMQQLKELGGGLLLSGDFRSDSPGPCAKYGSCTLIEDRINKVIDVRLVQSSEVPKDVWCELEGLKRSIRFFSDSEMNMDVLVTDRSRQVAMWVKDHLVPQGTKHFYDLWHCEKGLSKKLDTVIGERDCNDLALWKKSIVNHLYWTAASTPDGNPDLMEAKWKSLVNHIQDIHEHETPEFPVCLHPPLVGINRNKRWLVPGSIAAVELENAAFQPEFVKQVRQLSPQHQTYSLEAFHSLILKFAPKHTELSSLSMYSRLLLAALHYNSNDNGDTARTKEGVERDAVSYPRFKNDGRSVQPLKVKPTYDYATALLKRLQDAYTSSPTGPSSAVSGSTSADPGPQTM